MSVFSNKASKNLIKGNIAAMATIVCISVTFTVACCLPILWISIKTVEIRELSVFILMTSSKVVSMLAMYLTTKNLRKDMKTGKTFIKQSEIKEVHSNYSNLDTHSKFNVPFIGNFFHRHYLTLWLKQRCMLIVTKDGEKYIIPVDSSIIENSKIKLYFSQNSKLFVGCEVI